MTNFSSFHSFRFIFVSILLGVLEYACLCIEPLCAEEYTKKDYTEKKVISLGGIFDLTGAGQSWGYAERDGFILAVEDFTAANPTYHVSFEIEDSGYSQVKSVTAWKKLVSLQGKKIIVGPTWEPFVAVVPLCVREKVICIAPSYSAPEISGKPTVFGLWYDNRGYVEALLPSLRAVDGLIGVIAAEGPYYDLLLSELQKIIPPQRLVIERVRSDEREVRPVVERLRFRKISALVLYVSNGPAQSALKAIKELHLDTLVLFNDDAVLYLNPRPKGLGMSVIVSEPRIDEEQKKEFDKRFYKRFKRAPEAPSGAVAYDGTLLALTCARDHYGASILEVAKCFSSVQGYRGYSGAITFSKENLAEGRGYVSRTVKLE